MKIRIDLPDALLQEIKKMARQKKTTVKALVEAALRVFLKSEKQNQRPFTLRTHTFRGNGLQPGLKEGDWSEILRRPYEGRVG